MKLGKKEFIAGLLLATVSTTGLMEIASIHAASREAMQTEIRFSRQLGLFDTNLLSEKNLDRQISKSAFFKALGRVLYDTAIIKSFDLKEMVLAGIIAPQRPDGNISRKEAAETVLRAVMSSQAQGILPSADQNQAKASFKDWQPEEKYLPAFDYAISSGILQGADNGKFLPDARLKVKEAMILLKRLHDLAKKFSHSNKMGLFKDVVQDHYMTIPLLNLRKAGAFDLTDLGKNLDATGHISCRDLSLMIQGILGRQDKAGHLSQLKQFSITLAEQAPATRSILAQMAGILVTALPHSESNQHILYSDVKADSSLANFLDILAKAGIRMGYNNNMFAGHEKVSRFEALGLLNRITTELEPSHATAPDLSNTQSSDNLENFKKLLQERKVRIRRILSRE
jgi:hypothetical protein